MDVDIGIHVLALGRQSKDHVGVVPLAEWLPKSKRWLPVGHGEPQCFRQEALSPFDSPNRGSSGQARCRHRNFVLIFNLFSRLDRRRSEATWKNVFPGIVTGTKTTERCLDPEQMTFLADYENPPFPSRAIDPDTMVVASMCGSGGCRCFRCDPSLDRRSRTCSDPHDATA